MANSRFQYVRKFEAKDPCLLNCWLVIRIDGRCFHKFCDVHRFRKPNDERALALANKCAESVMREFGASVLLAYGEDGWWGPRVLATLVPLSVLYLLSFWSLLLPSLSHFLSLVSVTAAAAVDTVTATMAEQVKAMSTASYSTATRRSSAGERPSWRPPSQLTLALLMSFTGPSSLALALAAKEGAKEGS